MLAILFVLMIGFFGCSLIRFLIPDVRRLFSACSPSRKVASIIPEQLFVIPAGFITGFLIIGATLYYLTLALSYLIDDISMLKKISILITFLIYVILGSVNYMSYLKKKSLDEVPSDDTASISIPCYNNTIGNGIYYSLTTVVITFIVSFLMLYTYRIAGNELWAGFSTFSDLSPHTAMTSSFGVGNNFPTEYMHFSGDGIKYHFFFYFVCGTLQYLGLPIDMAINVPSILTMVCALLLLGTLSVLLSRRRTAFAIAPLLVFFRSSLNCFYQIDSYRSQGFDYKTTFSSIMHNSSWYEKTPYDSWGIWAINVYPNQRHLMLGIGAILILIILFMPFVRRMFIGLLRASGAPMKLKTFFISKEAWIFREKDPLKPVGIVILSSLIVLFLPYFHGSALIAALLILFGMCIFSESRLLYLIVALTAICSSFLQTSIFSGGASNLISFGLFQGFVVENPTPSNVLNYLFIVTGLAILLALLYVVILIVRDLINKKPIYRVALFAAFLFPLIFAFNVRLTSEVLANHKFIQITLILVDAFVASLLSELFILPKKARKALKRWVIPTQVASSVLALILTVVLTLTGVFEWATYINLNKNHVTCDINSQVTEWIVTNTDEDDVFLTPTWSMNRFFLSGRAAFYGWPYYAWSANHDTYTREINYYWLLTGSYGNIDEFMRYCKEQGIRYLIDDPEFFTISYPEGFYYNQDFFRENLIPVAYFPSENGTTIYKIY